jgi:hypothetical protein
MVGNPENAVGSPSGGAAILRVASSDPENTGPRGEQSGGNPARRTIGQGQLIKRRNRGESSG